MRAIALKPTKRLFSGVLAASATIMLMGCPEAYKDDDPTYRQARPIPDLEVEDSIDFDKGDREDWKSVTPMEDGTGTIKLVVGDPFEGKHGVTGSVAIFTEDAKPLAKARITPNQVTYEVPWKVEGETMYFVRIAADRGKSRYAISFELEAKPKDPCEDVECDDDERCVEGECIELPKPEGCNPPCRSGYECEENECVKVEKDPCPGGCKKGYYCSRRRGKCLRDPCYQKNCPSGTRCRYGKCEPVGGPVEKPKTCDPPCGSGKKCVGTTCVDDTSGPISAKIIQMIPQGEKTVLILSRGKKHFVKKNDTGKVPGAGNFVITQVYDGKCKALIKKPSSAIGTSKATIFRK